MNSRRSQLEKCLDVVGDDPVAIHTGVHVYFVSREAWDEMCALYEATEPLGAQEAVSIVHPATGGERQRESAETTEKAPPVPPARARLMNDTSERHDARGPA